MEDADSIVDASVAGTLAPSLPAPPSTQPCRNKYSSAAEVESYRVFVPPSAEEKGMVDELLLLCTQANVEYCFTRMKALRFLRDKKRVVQDAFASMRLHAEWVRSFGVAGITEDSIKSQLQKKLFVRSGYDKKARPVLYILIRNHNSYARDLEQLRRCIVYCLEMTLRDANPDEERITVVLDMSEFSFRCMDYEAVRSAVELLQNNYPETLNTALVCNAPFAFSACYAVIRPWLDPVTAAKVAFIRGRGILDFIDERHIPADCLGFHVRDKRY